MVERRRRLGFLHKPPLPLGVRHGFQREHLYRNRSIQVSIAGLIYDPHPALAELRFNPAMAQRLANQSFTCRAALYWLQ